MAYDTIISHSSHSERDKATADAVCAALEAKGISCWIAPRDVMPGMGYGEAIVRAIDESRMMVLILSRESNESQHVMREAERAVSKSLPIVTFRIEDTPPSRNLEYFLSATQWLDALTPPMEEHIAKLVSVVEKSLKEGVQTPAPFVEKRMTARELAARTREWLGKRYVKATLPTLLALVVLGAGAFFLYPLAGLDVVTFVLGILFLLGITLILAKWIEAHKLSVPLVIASGVILVLAVGAAVGMGIVSNGIYEDASSKIEAGDYQAGIEGLQRVEDLFPLRGAAGKAQDEMAAAYMAWGESEELNSNYEAAADKYKYVAAEDDGDLGETAVKKTISCYLALVDTSLTAGDYDSALGYLGMIVSQESRENNSPEVQAGIASAQSRATALQGLREIADESDALTKIDTYIMIVTTCPGVPEEATALNGIKEIALYYLGQEEKSLADLESLANSIYQQVMSGGVTTFTPGLYFGLGNRLRSIADKLNSCPALASWGGIFSQLAQADDLGSSFLDTPDYYAFLSKMDSVRTILAGVRATLSQ